jgi:site-specific DNA recombinase
VTDDSTTTGLVPAIGYIRVSMMHEEAISPELQRTAIEDWARRRGRKVIGWVTELDKTGRNFQRDIMKVIGRIEAGEAREIAVWKYSRFGRSRHGCAVNLARIEAAGGRLQSATEEVDAKTAVGKLTRGMLMEIAAFESDRAGEQWGEARSHRVAAGLQGTGRAKFGYVRLGRIPDPERPGRTRRDLSDRLGERYEPEAMTGPVLREMYLTHTAGEEGWQFAAIAQWLNLAQVFNTYGRPWSWDTVRDVLDSGFGAGYLRVHDPACDECGSPSRCLNKVYLPGAHKPVIEEWEWQAYTARRALVASWPPRARSAVYSLTGLVVCGHCGSKMGVLKADGKRNKQHRLRCSRWTRLHDCASGGRKVPYPVAEKAVRDWLTAEGLARETGPEAIAAAATAARASAGQLAQELAKIDRAMARALQRELLEDDVGAETWAQAKAGLLAGRAPVAAALEAARKRAGTDPQEMVTVVRGALEVWDLWRPDRLRDALATVISAVVVWREDDDDGPAYRARVFPVWEPPWGGPGSAGIPG